MKQATKALNLGLVSLVCFFFANAGAHAVLFYSTADPGYNTSAPDGSLTGSGWQWEGSFGSYLGTAIAPQYFITAKHIGGTVGVGDNFTLNGSDYTTTAVYNDPNADLAIWQVSGSFSSWAPLYGSTDEVGKSLVVFGRGTQRGNVIITDGVTNGWLYGSYDGVERWGQNSVYSTLNGGSSIGSLLYSHFDYGAGSNECHLSSGDTGGGLFIQSGGGWALAGVNYSVNGLFNTNTVGNGFTAALVDEYHLNFGSSGNWTYVTSHVPSGFYDTRISTSTDWINSVIPEPSPILLTEAGVLGLLLFLRNRRLS